MLGEQAQKGIYDDAEDEGNMAVIYTGQMHLFDPQVAPCPPDALCCMNCDEAKVQVLAEQRQMYRASCLKRTL